MCTTSVSRKNTTLFNYSAVALCLSALLQPVQAQQQEQEKSNKSTDKLFETIEVTARKRVESIQDVPVSITAFGESQLDAMKFRNMNDLSVGIANVMLDDVGTARGVANFSIRGLGINSSITSIDPTVGVFIDGVFIGTNGGVVVDMFDIARIEVLRGPQGILFGRNVTGGAILITTRQPEDVVSGKVRASVAGGGPGGLNKTVQGAINIPLADNLYTKLSVYHNDDDGWFENKFDGSDHGAVKQTLIRSTTLWEPTSDLSFTLKYENLDLDGDGPSGQNHVNGMGISPTLAFSGGHPLAPYAVTFDRDSFDIAINEPGYQQIETDLLSLNMDWDVGGGTMTYIFGWRDYYSPTRGDIDAQPFTLFHSNSWTTSEQFSHELRFNKDIGKANVTAGLYHYTNDMLYHERRELPLTTVMADINADGTPDLLAAGIYQDGGGLHDTKSVGAFTAVDYDLSEQWTVSAGLRYTREEKSVQIASMNLNVSSINSGFIIPQGPVCNIYESNDCVFDFTDNKTWSNVSPKVGVRYELDSDTNLFASWSKGFRSGGYNLRNTADISTPELKEANGPGPFDEEEVNNYEVGYKGDTEWGRFNAAAFITKIDDMQREVSLPAPDGSLVQIIKNTAEATLTGIEFDGMVRITSNLVAMFNLGLIDAEYDEVIYDLNGDGVVDGDDKALEIPRVPEVTYSVGLNYDHEIVDWGILTSRINYSYRDKTFYTDNNLGYIDDQKILNAGLDFETEDMSWVVSIFGKNLLNDVKQGNDTQLSFGTFSPLAKGREIGVEVTYYFQ
ncbi:TonB-dependent receptor [Alteromonas gilva]|uniref:TonB-dependent receptor n=1 Tax=Alteromonas gilva TaxID=2987522 RepID=A0ABT5L168_9ALTE|nr:TonB-dependent receptor [Alteromonas gilva]MDC8830154.1 TonB-dependent receptor [Alteromonas gilva]